MKVRVGKIAPPYTDVPTKSLQAVLRNHAYDKLNVRVGTEQLFEIMNILVERREKSGCRFKSNEEAWAEFVKHYMPKESKPLQYDYAGGFDHTLLELADVLPASAYKDASFQKNR